MRLLGNKIMSLRALALLCVMSASSAVTAEEMRPFIIGGVAFGGETLVETTSSDLDAGGLIYFGGGVLYEPDNSDLMYQFSIGYKFDSVEFAGPNGETSVSVMPLDAVAFYTVDNIQLGAGLAYYLNPEWELCFDGAGCGVVNFDDSLGLVLEVRSQMTDIWFWGARYTNVDYEVSGASIDASNLRIHFGMMF